MYMYLTHSHSRPLTLIYSHSPFHPGQSTLLTHCYAPGYTAFVELSAELRAESLSLSAGAGVRVPKPVFYDKVPLSLCAIWQADAGVRVPNSVFYDKGFSFCQKATFVLFVISPPLVLESRFPSNP